MWSRLHGGKVDVVIGARSALYDGHVWVRTVKLYADGALGSRGAALLAPYSDDPGNSGLLLIDPKVLEATTAARASARIWAPPRAAQRR